MTELQLQRTAEGPNVQEMPFWLEKATLWDQSDSSHTRKDISLNLRSLRDFFHQVLTEINNVSSTTETMKRLPLLGQVLGRLCWNPYVTADGASRGLLLQCLLALYSEHPSNAVERKANEWIRKVLCRLTTEEDDGATLAMMKHLGVPTREYYVKVLNKMVTMIQESIWKSRCSHSNRNQKCSCGSIQAASEAFMSLITCAEASPVIGTLLQQPAPCIRGGLSENFIDALHSAYSRCDLPLEEEVVISLWCHSLPFLEEAVLSLLDSATAAGSTPDKIKEQVTKSLLPKACAQHCSIFLVVNDIFRTVLKRAERNECVKDFLQTFTKCFLRELTLLQPQTSASLKAFFPQSPSSLLLYLLTMPSEMPRESWKNHLMWVSSTLQRLTEEEEEEEGSDAINIRGHSRVFEAWFLLAQCAHWVQVAVQLLVTSGPEDCGSLLWLLTFYHRPTNRWHHRAAQLVQAKAAWDQLYSIFSVGAHPLPADRLQPLLSLLSSRPQQLSLITLHLLVSFAVFGQLPLSTSTEITLKVLDQSGLREEAAHFLSSLRLQLNDQGCSANDSVSLRVEDLHSKIKQM
ncbi:PREDICTED: Fanconi anemia group C protein isoform X1 [Cyprinodon variegatus]|uniref:Fanconi anemia group C protein isoform X1 n=2 Tax=Cyprinodon variegatus TaxID=28743 RepID=UPI0007425516|nr:PREDICTED: Fanconi anemia group C protein isoform X1 [Cyprinodon variegatus]XP_015251325.1 PREDICTED: Fanconi anemia group C protein isoform X1 [Cyprinodon variegatus]XP_015251334.1 PREDICTED: Fanconi anemia group C protein isoform X1 [Cyprinodon variegatus]